MAEEDVEQPLDFEDEQEHLQEEGEEGFMRLIMSCAVSLIAPSGPRGDQVELLS